MVPLCAAERAHPETHVQTEPRDTQLPCAPHPQLNSRIFPRSRGTPRPRAGSHGRAAFGGLAWARRAPRGRHRTDKQQRRLRRRNLNATNSQSTHSYGASFDIAFVDRMDDDASCGTPTREMERLLNRYQKAGIIYVIPEGGCMHVTLRKP